MMQKSENKPSEIFTPLGSEQTGGLSLPQLKEETDKKLKDINFILLSVVIILLVMVGTMIIDSFHFNSVVYKEYSEKTKSVEQTQKINQGLLDQNQKNQQLIIDQQNQILQLLKQKSQ